MEKIRRPNLFIVGAAKAGTTSLYAWLKRHPLVYMSPVKEPHFFGTRVGGSPGLQLYRSLDRYLSLFAAARDEHVAAGEASTSYLWDPDAPGSIRDFSPDAKVIILLRDPVDRAYSHYLMDLRNGRQALPFYEALVQDYYHGKKLWGDGRLYVEVGLYAEQVERYLEAFGSERVLIVSMLDLRRDPLRALERTLSFVGVEGGWEVGDVTLEARNQFALPRNGAARAVNRYINDLMAKYMLVQHLAYHIPEPIRRAVRWVLFGSASKPPRDERAVEFLLSFYERDVDRLEGILGRKMPDLRATWPRCGAEA